MIKISKIFYNSIEITQLLHATGCTYDEAEQILEITRKEFAQQREELEYDTVENYLTGKKVKDAGNIIVQKLNHCEPYL